MPSPWLAVLKNVPWVEVIRNATTVAEGARKLWNSVRRQPPQAGRAGAAAALAAPTGSPDLAGVNARLAEVERALAELQQEMLASSDLIRNLADQNAQLVARIDAIHRHTLWLVAATAACGIVATVALVLLLTR